MTRILGRLGLTIAQIEARRDGIGGSDAGKLMGGDPDAIMALWEVKTGKRQDDDLSRVLPVQIGLLSEPLNLDWYERETGRLVTNEGEPRKHVTYPWMRCTLDGLTVTERGNVAVLQAKHVNAFSNIDDVVQRYMAQVHHEMAVVGCGYAILSVLIGTQKWECFEIECDDWYLSQLIDRERAFWRCVETDTPPHNMDAVKPPETPTAWRKVDMTGNNEWSFHAADWLANKGAADTFKKADKGLKELMADDVGEASGHGITAKRDKKGAIRVAPIKEGKKGRKAA